MAPYNWMDETDQEQEHRDFHYSTDAEWDRAAAREIGEAHPDRAWILTDRDVWHENPFYRGPAVPHPEEYHEYDDYEPVEHYDAHVGAYMSHLLADIAF